MSTNSIHTLTMTTFTYGGDALGRLPDGRAVFMPFTLPGETVRVRLVEEKTRYARAELLEVLTPAAERITPRCVHFGECGGCHYQHLSYEAQLEAKADILRDQFERIGKLDTLPVVSTIPSERPFNYRNHIQFHLTEEGRMGYHKPRSKDVLPIEECHLPEALINHLWPQLDFDAIPELERVGIRTGANDDLQMILESREPLAPELLVEGLPVSVVHLSLGGALVMAGSESVIIEVLERPFRVSADSFFQVNTHMAGLMVELLLDELNKMGLLNETATVIDAYCGAGLFSAFLAPRVGRLIGIESSPSACEDFVVNLDEYENIELYEAPVEIVLPEIQKNPDLLLLDPPRAGLDRRVMDSILELKPQVLAYISCDPATLARDAKKLAAGGYRLRQIALIDMFPQTYHIESLSFWLC
ncbi:MAG: class I SAM-dependent RNA methyltransferase [Chloroflexota bacterium]|nr:class I SAM-dependent RNA methyltransferase [Chloroflexota bacterium]